MPPECLQRSLFLYQMSELSLHLDDLRFLHLHSSQEFCVYGCQEDQPVPQGALHLPTWRGLDKETNICWNTTFINTYENITLKKKHVKTLLSQEYISKCNLWKLKKKTLVCFWTLKFNNRYNRETELHSQQNSSYIYMFGYIKLNLLHVFLFLREGKCLFWSYTLHRPKRLTIWLIRCNR